MKIVMRYLISILPIMILSTLDASAAFPDNGTNENGKMVVSATLSKRCGLSSDNPVVGIDCLKRLASDYIHSEAPGGIMSSQEEFDAIISEYMAAYLAVAAEQLHKSGTYEEDSDKLAGKDPELISADNDARADIEANNKISNDNSAREIDALDVRSMEININNVETMIGNVKKIADDIKKDSDEDKELRKVPTQVEETAPSGGGENGQ